MVFGVQNGVIRKSAWRSSSTKARSDAPFSFSRASRCGLDTADKGASRTTTSSFGLNPKERWRVFG
jgi:hypothetical protein